MFEQKVKQLLGEQQFAIVALQTQLEAAQKRIAELEANGKDTNSIERPARKDGKTAPIVEHH